MSDLQSGIVYSAYGYTAREECLRSIHSLRLSNPDYPIAVSSDDISVFRNSADVSDESYPDPSGREAKLNIDRWTPFKKTLYLDADTRVHGDISPIFHLLTGFEFVCTLSSRQGNEWHWKVDKHEAILAAYDLGYQPIRIQGGVFAFRKTNAARKFFANWRKAYKKYPNNVSDQVALTTAFHTSPMKAAILSRQFNGGAIIQHRFGSIT